MRPIRDISDLQPTNVLYHSAFGFARVERITDGAVEIAWERRGPNLPPVVTRDALRRVYTLCTPGGFFERAMNEPDALRELLQVQPVEGMAGLLVELPGPQTRQDLKDWVAGRNLMSERAFDRWWEALLPQVADDQRFRVGSGTLELQERSSHSILHQLDENPNLSPSRRLDISLAYRNDLGEDRFRHHAVMAWRTGSRQVRDLALAALRDHLPDAVLREMLTSGPDPTDALIHAIRRAGWSPDDIHPDVQSELLERLRRAADLGGPLDSEGRLTAAVTRWGVPGAISMLATLAAQPNGQRLLYATFASLPPRRAQELALDMLDQVLARGPDAGGAQWLGTALLMQTGLDHVTLSQHLPPKRTGIAAWLVEHYVSYDDGDPSTDELSPSTIEIELEPIETTPVLISELPPRLGNTVIDLGIALARALSVHHNNGHVVHPTRYNVRLRPDGSVDILRSGGAEDAPRAPSEAPSQASDLHAAGVLLVEALLGRAWPRDVPADRAIPYLRQLVPDLPPGALAPIDAVLHPDPAMRPPDGMAWLQRWQVLAEAEELRSRVGLDDACRLEIGFDSHIGRMKILHTQTNQDALFAAMKSHVGLMVVCDGISTANAGSGDVASGITAHVLASLWEQAVARLRDANHEGRRDFLERALRMANRAVCEAALRFAGGNIDGRVPMGTTSVTAISRHNQVSIGWLGDSRAYLVGPWGCSLLTADQNQANERLRMWHRGVDAYWDPGGFALVGYVGHFNESHRPLALPPGFVDLSLLPGERLVLCSDGITDYVGDSHPEVSHSICGAVLQGTPEAAARALVELANRGGGGDNATVLVAEVSRQ